MALAGPQWGIEVTEAQGSFAQTVIAVDVSASMRAQDVKPTRLENAKRMLQMLVTRLREDRLGIIAFTSKAYIQCPITTDTDALNYFITSLQPDMLPVPGTSLAAAVELAARMLSTYPGQKALILLTDGEDHAAEELKHAKEVAQQNAIRVIADQFDAFKNRHFQKIMTRLHLSEEEMKGVMDEIRRLNPSPGGQIDDSYNDQAQQVVPDFHLDYENGQLILTMPRFNVPELRINRKYSEIMENGRLSDSKADKEAASFVKQKIDSAKWFIEALRQRQNTLQSTMQAIIDYQHDYFVDGDESNLKPMVLKDIAEITGFDISTISRVVNSKWIETHFGVFPLKYFFSEGLENSDGEEVSTREIKKALREMVDGEDKHNPLTDDELVDGLSARGYKVARRTIAKYRAQLYIPKARLRREL